MITNTECNSLVPGSFSASDNKCVTRKELVNAGVFTISGSYADNQLVDKDNVSVATRVAFGLYSGMLALPARYAVVITNLVVTSDLGYSTIINLNKTITNQDFLVDQNGEGIYKLGSLIGNSVSRTSGTITVNGKSNTNPLFYMEISGIGYYVISLTGRGGGGIL